MSSKNGKTRGCVLEKRSFAELAAARMSGDLAFRADFESEDPIQPPLEPPPVEFELQQEIELPETDILIDVQIEDGRAALKMLAQNLRAKKEIERENQQEQLRVLQQTVEKKRETIAKIAETVTEIWLKGIKDIDDIMSEEGLSTDLLDSPSPYSRNDGQILTVGQQREEWRGKIDKYRNHKDAILSLTIIAKEATFWLSKQKWSDKGLLDNLENLVKEGVLRQNNMGNIVYQNPATFFKIRFSLHRRFDSLEAQDQAKLHEEIRTAVDNQVFRLKEEHRQAQEKDPGSTIPGELSAKQFHRTAEPGLYTVKLPAWEWDLKDENGKRSDKTTRAKDLEIVFERFRDQKGATRLKITSFSPQHKEFLEGADCLNPEGYPDNPGSQIRIPFFYKILLEDRKKNLPQKK